jgi:tyrosyl-tRNA synthetase
MSETLPSIDEQMQVLLRGVESVYSADELRDKLTRANTTGNPLRVKLGMDPTAPDLHVGHSVVLRKLRQFQDFGHKAVLIIGDYTARVGDPSGQNTTRPILSPEQIKENAATYFRQAGTILDTASGKLEIRYNSEWLNKLSFADILRLTAQMTVARMMERDTFEQRFRKEVPIGVHEFLYPLMQAYDSVCIQADVELGGTDQTFNNLCGRDIQRAYEQPPQVVVILPILVGLDGTMKMSKSKGNYIAVTDEPNDMFGKVMSIPDRLMDNYFTLLTDTPAERIAELVDPEKTHPRDAKAVLARAIVSAYHDEEAAEAAAAEFDRVFADRQRPTDMPEIELPSARIKMGVVELITRAGFARSSSEAGRLVKQGAVSLDGEKVTDVKAVLKISEGQVLQVGKRRFGKIRFAAPAE